MRDRVRIRRALFGAVAGGVTLSGTAATALGAPAAVSSAGAAGAAAEAKLALGAALTAFGGKTVTTAQVALWLLAGSVAGVAVATPVVWYADRSGTPVLPPSVCPTRIRRQQRSAIDRRVRRLERRAWSRARPSCPRGWRLAQTKRISFRRTRPAPSRQNPCCRAKPSRLHERLLRQVSQAKSTCFSVPSASYRPAKRQRRSPCSTITRDVFRRAR